MPKVYELMNSGFDGIRLEHDLLQEENRLEYMQDKKITLKDLKDFVVCRETFYQSCISVLEENKHLLDEFLELEEDYYGSRSEVYRLIKDRELDGEVYNFLYEVNNLDIMKDVASKLDLKIDKVGYSHWSYYIAHKDLDEGFISDLWNGWNFYTVFEYNVLDNNELEYNGNAIDFYAKDEEDILLGITNNFDVELKDLKVFSKEFDYLLEDYLVKTIGETKTYLV